MRNIKGMILGLSLLLGMMGTYGFAEYLPRPAVVCVQNLAWWGALYPEACLPGAMQLIGGEEAELTQRERKEIPVEIRFKYLTFLNQSGD